MLAPLRFSADPCNGIAQHRHLYYQASKDSMSVTLRFKFQSGSRRNLAVKKK